MVRTVYIVALNGTYLTNKTNVTRLWEVIERELGTDLYLSYQKESGDEAYTTIPARKHKIKTICQTAYRHRIYIHQHEYQTDYNRDDLEKHISIFQDLLGGRD